MTPHELSGVLQEARKALSINNGALMIVADTLGSRHLYESVSVGIDINNKAIAKIDQALASIFQEPTE